MIFTDKFNIILIPSKTAILAGLWLFLVDSAAVCFNNRGREYIFIGCDVFHYAVPPCAVVQFRNTHISPKSQVFGVEFESEMSKLPRAKKLMATVSTVVTFAHVLLHGVESHARSTGRGSLFGWSGENITVDAHGESDNAPEAPIHLYAHGSKLLCLRKIASPKKNTPNPMPNSVCSWNMPTAKLATLILSSHPAKKASISRSRYGMPHATTAAFEVKKTPEAA